MIRSTIVFLIAFFLGMVIQATVKSVYPGAVAPDFMLILVVFFSLRHRNLAGLFAAFLLGILSDFASARYVGPGGAGAVIAFSVLAILSRKIYAERGPAIMLLAFFGSVAKSLTYAGVVALYINVNMFSPTAIQTIFFEALLNGFLAPLVVRLLDFSAPQMSSGPASSDSLRRAANW